MAHFAELDENNKVLRVIVIDNDKTHDEDGVEREELGIAFCKELFGANTTWVQTSYNAQIRGKYAGTDDIYLPKEDKFVIKQPYPSWTLDKNLVWQPPVIAPDFDGETQKCYWDENTKNWVVESRETPLAIE